MKPLMKIGSFLVLLYIGFFLIYRVTLMWNQISIQNKTARFLDAVQTQNFEEATNLYSGTTDKKIWVNEMRKLYEEDGFRLLSYDDVKAVYDDGSISTGHANLTFEVDGKPLKIRAILTFGTEAKPGEVCAIHPSGVKRESIPELITWNQMTCGGSF
jgi:hypothetical protein